MNSTDTNVGGWQSSEMRTYVNNDIYNLIPSELRDLIIDTTVISGHGESDSANFTTTDKLYLLSIIEVWNRNNQLMYYNQGDSASGEGITRQLDYYNIKGVTTSSCSTAIKQKDGIGGWWLRSAYSYGSTGFSYVSSESGGYGNYYDSRVAYGVSPAFRLAE
jgi:hypothetical protein